MDLVVNHISEQHEWFRESRSSKGSPKRDWYIWRKGTVCEDESGNTVRKPPISWANVFTGSAWQYDGATDEWYQKLFAEPQPDLNWDNADMRKAVHGIVLAGDLYCHGPHVHNYLQELRSEVLDPYGDEIIAVGETPNVDNVEAAHEYVAPVPRELDMIFLSDLMCIDHGFATDGSAGRFSPTNRTWADLKRTIVKWQIGLSASSGACNTVFLENQDLARSVSRFGDNIPHNRHKAAGMLAMLQTNLQGTLFIHQGQEIGIINLVSRLAVDAYTGIETRNFLDHIRSSWARIEGSDNPEMDTSPPQGPRSRTHPYAMEQHREICQFL